MPRVRVVVALVTSEENTEIPGAWSVKTPEECQAMVSSYQSAIADGQPITFTVDNGIMIVPHPHIEYVSLEYDTGS